MKMGRGESLNNRPLSRIIYIIFFNENIYFYMILSAHIFCRITMTNSKKKKIIKRTGGWATRADLRRRSLFVIHPTTMCIQLKK
ncbi:Uncharacterized protein APZ42_014275 [Daphnia magna]|uniref:Uncharacterized protein n=1 Tax=Daphnia magna TaxID=35525 RepID=A0A162Q6C0_9CRUS|nr:Uncharacterized protein APZ42_014275 [Daphnia magna]